MTHLVIHTRKVGKYQEISINTLNTIIDVGLHDKEEVKELIEHLKDVIEGLEERQ